MSAALSYRMLNDDPMNGIYAIEFDGIRIDTAYLNGDGWYLASDTHQEPVSSLGNLIREITFECVKEN